MRVSRLVVWAALGWVLPLSDCSPTGAQIQRRQNNTDTSFPPLSASSTSVDTTTTTLSFNPTSSTTSSRTSIPTSTTFTTKHSSSTTSLVPSASGTAGSNATASSDQKISDALPIQPRITPAFGIAGVFLLVLGAIYALIGVKSRWVQIFLSCGFLASIATAALVDYVMNPPVTDAVQGGFLVAILVTGVVFGGGALVFKEFTEGFACLLGGFCFSMWLLTLRPGGLITSSGGKGAFIGIFCLTVWALSFTQYTRPYALIGCISFSGATAFTLGVDCFTRAGLKEFWFYIWNLNDNLFPLNTNNFPLTRGIKVEIAVIVIGAIIGVLSQMKLWKVIRTQEREKEVFDEEGSRQREAVEAALGRHLQRQNEREKTEWEKQYGNRLSSQRNTMLWQDAHPEKRYSSVSVIQLDEGLKQASSEILEVPDSGQKRTDSTYGSRNKHQSTVDVIEEEEEGNPDVFASKERQKALRALERSRATPRAMDRKHSRDSLAAKSAAGGAQADGIDRRVSSGSSDKSGEPSLLRRLSQHSLTKITKHLSPNYDGNSQSQEHLIDEERPHSRASSAAATVDIDNEDLDASVLDVEPDKDVRSPPQIVISQARGSENVAVEDVTSRNDKADTPGSSVGGKQDQDALLADSAETSQNDGASSDGTPKPVPSQASETTMSSADSLTKTALASVPTQLSSVVLSYRTNEWAKHIATAEEPIYDEPENIEGIVDELPTRLVPISESEKEINEHQPLVEIPLAETLPPTVKAGGAGVGIASKPPPTQRSFSDQERRRSGLKTPPRSNSSHSLRLSSSRGHRASLNPSMHRSLVSTPIDEDTPMEFTSPSKPRPNRRVSAPHAMPSRSTSSSRSQTAYSPYGSTHDLLYPARPSTQQSSRPSTGTRMDTNNSHLPSQRNLQSDAQKRETLLADWRLSQQHRAASTGIGGGVMAEQSHVQMKAERDNQRLMEEQHRNNMMKKQSAMDQMMRRPDMQDLHRDAMRKMQAGANRKLKPTNN